MQPLAAGHTGRRELQVFAARPGRKRRGHAVHDRLSKVACQEAARLSKSGDFSGIWSAGPLRAKSAQRWNLCHFPATCRGLLFSVRACASFLSGFRAARKHDRWNLKDG